MQTSGAGKPTVSAFAADSKSPSKGKAESTCEGQTKEQHIKYFMQLDIHTLLEVELESQASRIMPLIPR